MKRNKIRKTYKVKINALNVAFFLFSITVGFLVVSLNSSIKSQQFSRQPDRELLESAHRIAEAFDYYNIKRFEK